MYFLKYKISFQNLKIGELNPDSNITLDLRVRFLPEPSKNYLHIRWDALVWSAMRQLYADMYRSTSSSTIVACTTLYMMPLDLNRFLEFHRSECQLDLLVQRVSFFQGST
jgi:hypothetical protein